MPNDSRGPSRRGEAPPEADEDEESGDFKLLRLLSAGTGQSPVADLLLKIFGGGRKKAKSSAPGGGEVPVVSMMAVSRVGPEARSVSSIPGLKLDKRAARIDGVYPEWDCEAGRYRQAWSWVTEYDAPSGNLDHSVRRVRDLDLRRRLVRLGIALKRHRRESEGDALDLEALVDLAVNRAMGEPGDDRVYTLRRKTAHDLGVLLLLDCSGSGEERHWGDGRRTYDEERQMTANLAVALEDIGDRVAIFGFNSQGRQSVQLYRVKDFDDRFDQAALRRLGSLEPSGYTRLGAAIRHGIHLVAEKSGSTNQLLVVISDGFPFDEGYEDVYAESDTRRAVAEGRYKGVGVVCLSMANATRHEALERVFGTAAHVRLTRASDLNEYIGGVLRSALRVASSTQREPTNRKQRSPVPSVPRGRKVV
jgi:nitric oxide reductase activation protein